MSDSRKVSVHEILGPPLRITRGYSEKFGRVVPSLSSFDPDAGWSWRDVLVWATDAARVNTEREYEQKLADWHSSNSH